MNERQELIAIAQGDMEAFERIFFIYQPRLVYFLTGLIHNEELGRDMAQDIFLSLWENRSKLSQIESFSAYIFKIARYTIYNYYDHLSVQDKYATEYLLKHVSDFASEEEQLFAKELSEAIDKVVDGLSPQRKRIYIMSRKEGFSNDEIAEKLNLNKRTVENHLTAVLAILRKVVVMSVCFYFDFNI